MRGTPPPRLVAWLFERLASGPNRESLGGDLAEQYRGGRSSAWYWRQVLMAVWASTTRDIGCHKLTAVRAVVTPFARYRRGAEKLISSNRAGASKL